MNRRWSALLGRAPLVAVTAIIAMVGIGACGDDDSDQEPASEPSSEPTGPTGSLSAEAFGEVEVGMSMEEVREIFGPPEQEEEVNFGATEPAPQVNWLWDAGDGTVYLEFETASDTLTGYHVSSSEFSTQDGVSVGDPIEPLEERFGDALAPAPIGTGFVLSEGKPGTFPALTLAVEKGRVIDIRGGSMTGAAGE